MLQIILFSVYSLFYSIPVILYMQSTITVYLLLIYISTLKNKKINSALLHYSDFYRG